jgi:hypothetical protein
MSKPVHKERAARPARWPLTGVALAALLLGLGLACSGPRAQDIPFAGDEVPPPNDRLYSQRERNLTVSTAVPSAEEASRIFGVNLYARDIQPVWVQVENHGARQVFLTPMGLDRAYFTPRETAYRSHSGGPLALLNKKFQARGLTRLRVPPGETLSGYVFSRVDEGTKTYNVDVMGDGEPYMLSFFVPVPGLKIDHYEVDIGGLYEASELRHLDSMAALVSALEAMPCCVRDQGGTDTGDPLNLVFVGGIRALYYAFLRAGWDETETINRASLWKTAMSALTGGAYRYSPVSALYVFGRPQDAALQRARTSIHERNHLRIWLTALRFRGEPVWIGQISRDIGVRFTWRTITTHKIDPDVDETRDFLLEDLAYAQVVEKFGYVGGVGAAPYEQPRGNLTGDPYFTDGQRLVIWISDTTAAIDDIEVLQLDQAGLAAD